MDTYKIVGEVIKTLVANNMKKATKFVSPKEVVRAVRKTYGNKIDSRQKIELVVTIGKPNYVERTFIRTAQYAGEPFPIRKIQLKAFVAKKK
jgi:hypothetical protein